MRATLPISWGYVSPPDPVKFVEQFDCESVSLPSFLRKTGHDVGTGTIDYGPFLSVNAGMCP